MHKKCEVSITSGVLKNVILAYDIPKLIDVIISDIPKKDVIISDIP